MSLQVLQVDAAFQFGVGEPMDAVGGDLVLIHEPLPELLKRFPFVYLQPLMDAYAGFQVGVGEVFGAIGTDFVFVHQPLAELLGRFPRHRL